MSAEPGRPLRVLHLIAGMAGGGAERQLAMLAREHVAHGLDVHVGLTYGGPNLHALSRSGAGIHWLANRGAHDASLFFRVLRLVRSVQPDIVQTWLPRMDVFGGLAARLCTRPWILSERNSAAAYRSWTTRAVRGRIGRLARAVVANSESGRAYWARRVPRQVACYVIPNGVPVDDVVATRAREPLPDAARSRCWFLFAGRLEAQKNLSTLVEAMRIVAGSSEASFLLCGEGSLRAWLEDAVAAAPLAGRAEVAGYREDLWGLMGKASALVSISHFEGHPNVVLEAMAAGCPVVLSDIPEHREFADEEHAWLVDHTDPADVASGMLEAIAGTGEAARRAALAARRVASLSVEASARRYEQAYRDVLGAERSS